MNAERLPDGRLLVPMRAESVDGRIGDALVEIGPEHPLFSVWNEYLLATEPTA